MPGLFDRLQNEIDTRGKQRGLSPIDLLEMPEELAGIINQIIRQNDMKLDDIAAKLGQPPDETKDTLAELEEKGFVKQVKVKEEIWYKAQFGRKADKSLSVSIWDTLDTVFDDNDDAK